MCRQTESHSERDVSGTNLVSIGSAAGWGWVRGWVVATMRVRSFRLGFALNERGREKVLAEV